MNLEKVRGHVCVALILAGFAIVFAAAGVCETGGSVGTFVLRALVGVGVMGAGAVVGGVEL